MTSFMCCFVRAGIVSSFSAVLSGSDICVDVLEKSCSMAPPSASRFQQCPSHLSNRDKTWTPRDGDDRRKAEHSQQALAFPSCPQTGQHRNHLPTRPRPDRVWRIYYYMIKLLLYPRCSARNLKQLIGDHQSSPAV